MTEIVVALRAEDMEWARGSDRSRSICASRCAVVEGGDSRQQSVENALATLDADTDLVAVHDAVRPFIDLELVDKVIAEAAQTGAAIVGIVPVDTVKRVHKNKIRADHSARASGAGADSAGVPLRSAEARLRKRARRIASPAPMNPAWWSGWNKWK